MSLWNKNLNYHGFWPVERTHYCMSKRSWTFLTTVYSRWAPALQFPQNAFLLLKWTGETSNVPGCKAFRRKTDKIIWCHLRLTRAEDHKTAGWHTDDYSWHSCLLCWRERTMVFCCGKWTVRSSNLCQNNGPMHSQQWNWGLKGHRHLRLPWV